MYVRRAIAVAGALVTAFAARPAQAWQEAHQTGDDTTVVVDANGSAAVTEQLRWHVVRGPLRPFDLANVDPSAVVDPEVAIVADDGRTLGGHAVRRDDHTVRVTADDPRATMKGHFTLAVRSRLDLVAAHAMARDGATWRLVWSAPVALDGFDNARTTIDLPAAPGEPRPIVADTGAIDDTAVATLRRGPERDVLELLRPHVARGESAAWAVRVDSRALPLVLDPQAAPSQVVRAPPEPDRVREVSAGVALVALAIAFGLLVRHKERAFVAHGQKSAARARGLLPVPGLARAALSGAGLAAAVGLEVAGNPTAGAACIAVAILASALRAPRATAAPRGPGQWMTLDAARAFASPSLRGHWLDLGSTAGRLTALLAGALVAAAAILARRFDEQSAWLVTLDAAVLVPLFVTGRACQGPPHGVRSAAPWLLRALRRLRSVPGLHATPWARVAPDGVAADELRLLVVPRVATPGVVGLEIGLAWSPTPVGWAAVPEVLARVLDGSAAAFQLARELPKARSMPGRRADERVVRLLPKAPTVSSTVALVQALAEALTDKSAERVSRKSDAARPVPRGAGARAELPISML